MKYGILWASVTLLTCTQLAAAPPLPVVAASAEQQAAMLESDDLKLAANKRLVYDMWRGFLLAGHGELVDRYFAIDYMQHNPMVDTGREALKNFTVGRSPLPIPSTIPNLVAVVAERDLVTLSFRAELPDPRDPGKMYTTTWFDMFRIENGKIQEHWDAATIPAAVEGPAKPIGN